MFTDMVGEHTLLDALQTMNTVATQVLGMYNMSAESKGKPKNGLFSSIYTVESAIARVPLVTILFGDLTLDLAVKYRHHCQEKGCRLGDHVAEGHVSSFQSADMEKNWPGAVLLGGYILSSSGLPPEYDEVMGLGSGMKLGLGSFTDAISIAALSRNRVFPRYTDYKLPDSLRL